MGTICQQEDHHHGTIHSTQVTKDTGSTRITADIRLTTDIITDIIMVDRDSTVEVLRDSMEEGRKGSMEEVLKVLTEEVLKGLMEEERRDSMEAWELSAYELHDSALSSHPKYSPAKCSIHQCLFTFCLASWSIAYSFETISTQISTV